MRCGRKPSKRPGEFEECDLTEPRQFNLMFSTRIGAVEGSGLDAYLRPETAQGIFVNFKNVAQIARRKPPFGIAQVGKSFSQRDHAGQFHLSYARVRADGDGVLRPARRGAGVVSLLGGRASVVAPPLRDPREPPPRTPARGRGALALLLRHLGHRIPLPHRLVGARGHRGPRRLRSHRAHRGVGDEARVDEGDGERALHAPRRRAGARRQPLDARVHGRRIRRGGRRRARAHRTATASCAGAGQGGRSAAHPTKRGHVVEGSCALRGVAAGRRRRVRRLGADRAAVSAQDEIGSRTPSRSTSRHSRTTR